MQLQEMRYIVTLAEQKNFSRAAKILYVSQPALSQAIKRLEEQLGVTLFVREVNNVYPTEAGSFAVKHAKTILEMTDYLTEGLNQFRDVNCLHIGISNNYNKYYRTVSYAIYQTCFRFKKLCRSVKRNFI